MTQVAALLAAPDTGTAAGRRDRAILLVLARLGLRGGEVAALRLADVDWRAGEVVVRGKASRVERLPLPSEVGEALARYLTSARPRCACPALFVTARAPYQALTGTCIRAIVGRACATGRSAAAGRAPAPPHPGHGAAAGGGAPGRRRSGAAPPQPVEHGHLREGRPRGAARAGPAVAGRDAMTTIRQHAEAYLAMRRRLGFKLTTFGQKLMSFVGYLERTDVPVLTTAAAVAWAIGYPAEHRPRALEPAADGGADLRPASLRPGTGDRGPTRRHPAPSLPADSPASVHPRRGGRPARRSGPTPAGVSLSHRADRDRAAGRDRSAHQRGLSPGPPDVDLADGVLTVRDTKFGKSRQVPLHASTVAALRAYAADRDRQHPAPCTPAFLLSTRGTRLDARNLPHTFSYLVRTAGLRTPVGARRPRLHDLRHTFATATLLHWYRDGADVQARLPLLTTYLGHADPKSTYWYLSGAPELLALAAARVEHTFGGQP